MDKGAIVDARHDVDSFGCLVVCKFIVLPKNRFLQFAEVFFDLLVFGLNLLHVFIELFVDLVCRIEAVHLKSRKDFTVTLKLLNNTFIKLLVDIQDLLQHCFCFFAVLHFCVFLLQALAQLHFF